MLKTKVVLDEVKTSIEAFGIKCFKDGQEDVAKKIRGYVKSIEYGLERKSLSHKELKNLITKIVALIKWEITDGSINGR